MGSGGRGRRRRTELRRRIRASAMVPQQQKALEIGRDHLKLLNRLVKKKSHEVIYFCLNGKNQIPIINIISSMSIKMCI